MIAPIAIALGLLVGLAGGGTLRQLERLGLPYQGAVLALFVLQGISRGRLAGTTASRVALPVWVLCCVALVAVLAISWKRPGVWIACVGMGLNVLVVVLNGGMPVAIADHPAEQAALRFADSASGFYRLLDGWTLFGAAGDLMPIGLLGSSLLLSPGDVLLGVGAATVVIDAMVNGGLDVHSRGEL